jgi:carnosine N-methyltransferase
LLLENSIKKTFSSQVSSTANVACAAGMPRCLELPFTNFCSQYAKVAHFNTTHLRRQSFYALPRAHLELLAAPPFSYLDTLNAVDDAIDKNAELSLAILQAGLESFGLPLHLGSSHPTVPIDWRGKATSLDLEKARSTLRQFYRDWSEEGKAERETCYQPVLKALKEERSARSGSRMRVLVPGAGLARLVFDLCCAGFDTEGNEISYHQLLASSYILNHCHYSGAHTLYPWVHSFSNHRNRANHLNSVEIPDLHPSTTLGSVELAGEMSMSASDFLLLYGDKGRKDTFDAVATVFFLGK